jgi:hypothetical protein
MKFRYHSFIIIISNCSITRSTRSGHAGHRAIKIIKRVIKSIFNFRLIIYKKKSIQISLVLFKFI